MGPSRLNKTNDDSFVPRLALRQALKSWNNITLLAKNPLASLKFVEARRVRSYPQFGAHGKGHTLRDALTDALEEVAQAVPDIARGLKRQYIDRLTCRC